MEHRDITISLTDSDRMQHYTKLQHRPRHFEHNAMAAYNTYPDAYQDVTYTCLTS